LEFELTCRGGEALQYNVLLSEDDTDVFFSGIVATDNAVTVFDDGAHFRTIRMGAADVDGGFAVNGYLGERDLLPNAPGFVEHEFSLGGGWSMPACLSDSGGSQAHCANAEAKYGTVLGAIE